MNKETFEKRIKALLALTNWKASFEHNEVQNAAVVTDDDLKGARMFFFNNVHGDAVYLQSSNTITGHKGYATRAPGLESDEIIHKANSKAPKGWDVIES